MSPVTPKKRVTRTRKPRRTTPPAAQPVKVRIRMYRQGLGDCFLLSFFTGPQPAHVLVDCGTLGATTTGVKMSQVVENIAAELKAIPSAARVVPVQTSWPLWSSPLLLGLLVILFYIVTLVKGPGVLHRPL